MATPTPAPSTQSLEQQVKAKLAEATPEKAAAHLSLVRTNLLNYAGKPDHNPYIMIVQLGLDSLEKQLSTKPTPELIASIMSIDPNVVPHVSKLNLIS